jgi:hypothetical protein
MPKAVQFRCDSDSRFRSLKLLNLMGVDAGNRARSARLMIVFADRTTAVQERHGLFSVDFAAALTRYFPGISRDPGITVMDDVLLVLLEGRAGFPSMDSATPVAMGGTRTKVSLMG